MNVRELIAKLETCPPEAKVAIGEPEAEGRVERMMIADDTPIVVLHAPLMHEKANWWEKGVGPVRVEEAEQRFVRGPGGYMILDPPPPKPAIKGYL
jgi:hypothetical protein